MTDVLIREKQKAVWDTQREDCRVKMEAEIGVNQGMPKIAVGI